LTHCGSNVVPHRFIRSSLRAAYVTCKVDSAIVISVW